MSTDFVAATAAVEGFLRAALEQGDAEAARAFISRESLGTTSFELPEEMRGAKHELGTPEETDEGIFVPVTITDVATGRSQTLPFAPTMEDGVWKLDMGRMMEKLMSGAMEQVGSAVGEAMEGIGEAVAGAMGAAVGEGGAEHAGGVQVNAEDRAKVEKRLEEINVQLSQRNDLHVRVEVDVGSMLCGEDEAANGRLLAKVTDDVLRNFVYAVTEANREVPLEGRVKAIWLEGVREARDRVVYSEGARIIYRLTVQEEGGFYDGQELGRILTGVAAGMAETALPGEEEGKGSYQPKGEAEEIVRNYRDFVAPALMKRIGEMLGHEVGLEVDWDRYRSPDEAKGLWTSGVNRICGAFGLLTRVAEVGAALGDAIQSIWIKAVPHKEMKSIEMNGRQLVVYFCPDDGEAGGFYEEELAELLSKKLKLKTRPMVAKLERYAKRWEKSLEELFGVGIKYAFDWDGFTCNEEEDRNVFALTQLRENGIDWMYYALAGLAEKNPNFRQQLPQRVRWIYLQYVPQAEMKGISGEQTTLVLKVYLHEGYDGYLTLKELEKALPGIVAGMPDIVGEAKTERMEDGNASAASKLMEKAPGEGEDEDDSEEQDETDPASRREFPAPLTDVTPGENPNDRTPQPYCPEPDTAAAALAGSLKAQFEGVLPAYAQQFAAMLGKPVAFDIDWMSVKGGIESLGFLLNAGLTPVVVGIAILVNDPVRKRQAQKQISRVVLRQTTVPNEHGFSLTGGTLVYTATLSPGIPPMDPQLAATLLGTTLSKASLTKRASSGAHRATSKPRKPGGGSTKKPSKKR